MLTNEQFHQWCIKLNLTEQAVQQIEQIRSSPPSRRVRSAVGNVSGRYPSRKMGVTIQFESHHQELAGIYMMEYDSEVREYYDQPPAIKLIYPSANGRRLGVWHTPDYFVIRSESAGWEEWKTPQELERLAISMPHRYEQEKSGRWRCPPGEAYAQQYGLYYCIRNGADINWNKQRNLSFLEDYFRGELKHTQTNSKEKLIAIVSTQPGITLTSLLGEGFNSDDIYSLIATEKLYVNLGEGDLATEPEKVQLFADVETAINNYHRQPTVGSTFNNCRGLIQVTVGNQIVWDGIDWQVVNTGQLEITLLNSEQKLLCLPVAVFEELIKQGQLRVTNPTTTVNTTITELLKTKSEQDCFEANRRYRIIAPYLRGEKNANPIVPERTFYRWVSAWREAERICGYGYIGLLPRRSQKGNRQPKLPSLTHQLIEAFITSDYETKKQKGKRAVYGALVKACEEKGTTVPSYKTFLVECNSRCQYSQTKKRQGSRAAYQHEPFYWELELTTPRHGNRPWEICHIDHTQLDIELVSSRTGALLGRPWATFLTDAYSRRILAIYLTFDPPSYRSCMMIMRSCVCRYGRLPQCVVVDGGKEFCSVYFEKLLAMYECTSKTRPSAKPRFGSVCERLFGTANTMFIHNLAGNTKITRHPRQVTEEVNPQYHAVWTLPSLYQNLCDWAYKFYDNQEHPALGQSPKSTYYCSMQQTGWRTHRLISYDETFRILTLPTTKKGTAKVIPNQGVKINQIYYWHNSFRSSEVEKTIVTVRYDPYDAGVAYAYLKGQWVSCISQYYSSFHGRSEREIFLATEELRQQYKQHSQQFTITAKALANFLEKTQTQESLLLQRLKDTEAKEILSTINTPNAANDEKTSVEIAADEPIPEEKLIMSTQDEPEIIEPYEEKW